MQLKIQWIRKLWQFFILSNVKEAIDDIFSKKKNFFIIYTIGYVHLDILYESRINSFFTGIIDGYLIKTKILRTNNK